MNSDFLNTEYLEKLSELLLDNVSDAIISTDKDFLIKTWNKAAEKIYGLAADEVRDKETSSVFRYEFLNDSVEISRKKLVEDGAWKGVVIFTRSDGKKVFLSASVCRIHNEEGDTVGYVAVNRDITDTYRMRDVLKNEERLNFALQGAGDGVWEYNFLTGETYYSPTCRQMLGFAEHEPTDGAGEWRARIHPADLALIADTEAQYQKSEIHNHSIEYRIKNKSGEYIWMLDRGMVIERTDDGKPVKIIGTHTDIDYRKKAEQKIRAFLESAPDAMVICSEDGTIDIVNSQAEKLFGYEKHEMIGKPVEFLIPQRFVEKHKLHRNMFSQDADARAMASGRELFARTKNGEEIPVEISLSPIYSDAGRMISAAVRDTSERKRTEKKLRQAQQLIESFMMNTPTMNWIIDEKNCFRFLNNSYMKAFQLSPEHIGKSIYEIFPAHICDGFVENNWRVWNSGAPLETIEEGIGPDGQKQIYQIFKFPLDSDDGLKLLGGVALDITSDIMNQEQLRLSNERYNYVSKATSDAIWDWDIQTDTLFRGDGYRSLFGYAETVSSLGMRMNKLIHPDDTARIRSELEQAVSGDALHWKSEYRFKCADDSFREVIDKAYIIRDNNGKAVRMIGAMQDVTEQRRLERELASEEENKKREVMQAIIKAQERERHEISHELHDNVNQILTTCKLLLEAGVQRDDKKYLEQSRENLQKAIDEMRNISHRLNPATLKYIGLKGSVIDLLNKINNTGTIKISFLTSLKSADIARINDEIQLALFRIIQEQLNNILRHAEAKNVTIELSKEGDTIKLTITDDGKGHDMQSKKHGLGLRNIFNRAEFHKGHAEIITEPGKGFRLQVGIPLT